MERLETITENLANNVTPGYRRAFPVSKSFDQTLTSAKAAKPSAAIDFSSGAIKETGNPFDFAINGDGFFAVGKAGKEFYTRNGHFTIGPNGTLMTDYGLNVLSNGSTEIRVQRDVDTSKLTVDSAGNLKAGDQSIGQLKLVQFPDPKALDRVGSTLFAKPQGMEPPKTQGVSVMNRSLEGSNTIIFEEMANMMMCMKNYETCNRMLKAQDAKDGQVIQQLSG